MISLGNGDHSASLMYKHVQNLMGLHSTLSGLQQGVMTDDQEWADYEDDVDEYLRMLKRHLLPVKEELPAIKSPDFSKEFEALTSLKPEIKSIGFRSLSNSGIEYAFHVRVEHPEDILLNCKLLTYDASPECAMIPEAAKRISRFGRTKVGLYYNNAHNPNEQWCPPSSFRTVSCSDGKFQMHSNADYVFVVRLNDTGKPNWILVANGTGVVVPKCA